jgi:hypothetical protein
MRKGLAFAGLSSIFQSVIRPEIFNRSSQGDSPANFVGQHLVCLKPLQQFHVSAFEITNRLCAATSLWQHGTAGTNWVKRRMEFNRRQFFGTGQRLATPLQ